MQNKVTPAPRLRKLKKETLVRKVRELETHFISDTDTIRRKDLKIQELTERLEQWKRAREEFERGKAHEEEMAEERHRHQLREKEIDAREWEAQAYQEGRARQQIEVALNKSKVHREPAPKFDAITETLAKGPPASTNLVLTQSDDGQAVDVVMRRNDGSENHYKAEKVTLEGLK